MNKYEVIEHKDLCDGYIFKVYSDKIQTPQGVITRNVVSGANASGVLAVFPNGDILLEKQYRHPIREEVYEVVAGKIDEGEEPEDAAVRELREETGYEAQKLTFINELLASPGYTTEHLFLFLAEVDDEHKGEQHFDRDEYVEVIRMPFKEAWDMVIRNEIKDGKTIVALTMYFLYKMDAPITI